MGRVSGIAEPVIAISVGNISSAPQSPAPLPAPHQPARFYQRITVGRRTAVVDRVLVYSRNGRLLPTSIAPLSEVKTTIGFSPQPQVFQLYA
ncbi:MAG: hypothetical protein R3F11_12435 [Verrucomicrobiales bacterium]